MTPFLRQGARALTAALAIVVPLLSCGRSEGTSPAQAPASRALTKVRISHRGNIGYAPLYIGKEERFFEQEGIDLELADLDANSALFAFTAGRVDVIVTPLRSGVFNAMGRGTKAQIVAERGHGDPAQCAAEAFVAPVTAVERMARNGLRGERIALQRGGSMEYLVDLLLEKQGLTRSDVELVQLPPSDSTAGGQRQVDAIRFHQEPALSNALTGGAKLVATMNELAPGLHAGVVVYGPRLLEDQDLGRRFMRAYLRGVRQYSEGKTGRNVEIISRQSGLPAALIRRACWQTISPDARVRPEVLEPFFAWARKQEYLEPGMPAAGWWNPSFVDAAAAGLAASQRP